MLTSVRTPPLKKKETILIDTTLTPEVKSGIKSDLQQADTISSLATASMLSYETRNDSDLKMRKAKFRSKMQSEIGSNKNNSHKRKSEEEWTENEYETFVKTVRRHGKN